MVLGNKDENIPVMISTNSLVIAAWRPRLYFIWRDAIMSLAFFDALSMAFRLGRRGAQNVRARHLYEAFKHTEHFVHTRELQRGWRR
jgi:hypothetical protein